MKQGLDVKPEQDNIPVLHHVFFSLGADQAFLPGGGHRAAGGQVGEGDHLRPDEAPLKVSVDFARSLGRPGALGDGPGAAFVLAAGEEADQAQQGVAGPDQPVQAGFRDVQFFPKPEVVLAWGSKSQANTRQL